MYQIDELEHTQWTAKHHYRPFNDAFRLADFIGNFDRHVILSAVIPIENFSRFFILNVKRPIIIETAQDKVFLL